jgi:uncharacterized lipoprotein
MRKSLLIEAVLVLSLAGCNDDKAKLEQQQHDQAIAAAAANGAAMAAAAAQAEKD